LHIAFDSGPTTASRTLGGENRNLGTGNIRLLKFNLTLVWSLTDDDPLP